MKAGVVRAPLSVVRCQRFIVSLLALLLIAVPARADGYKETKKRLGGAVVTLELDRTTLSLSEYILVTVTVEGTAPLEVEPIASLLNARDWNERRLNDPKPEPLPNGRARWQQVVRVEPAGKGEATLKFASVRFRDGSNVKEWVEQSWASVPVTITSVVEDVSLASARPATAIEELPPLPEPWPWLTWTGVALFGLLILAVVAWRLRGRPKSVVMELTPRQWAERELERIAALDLPAEGAVERYHLLLSDVLRHYLERRFQLRAPERTTPEFLDDLRGSSALPPEQQERLAEFLRRCDLAKFARAEFSPEDCREVGEMAKAFVRETDGNERLLGERGALAP